jgi:hypothetical protein
VNCGKVSCAEICCPVSQTCSTSGGTCPTEDEGFRLACDGPEDCNPGESCLSGAALSTPVGDTWCGSAAEYSGLFIHPVLCHQDSDCPAAEEDPSMLVGNSCAPWLEGMIPVPPGTKHCRFSCSTNSGSLDCDECIDGECSVECSACDVGSTCGELPACIAQSCCPTCKGYRAECG